VNFARLKCKSAKRKKDPRAGVLDEIAGTPVDVAAIALLVQRAERNADQRQEACNPAKDGARQHDVAVVQDKQDPDQPQRKSYPLQPRDFLAHEAVGECRGHDRLESQDERGDSGGYALTVAVNTPPRQSPCTSEPATRLWPTSFA
jgi:hypothetical protein